MKEKGVYLNIKKRGKRTFFHCGHPHPQIVIFGGTTFNDTIFITYFEYLLLVLLSHTLLIRFCINVVVE